MNTNQIIGSLSLLLLYIFMIYLEKTKQISNRYNLNLNLINGSIIVFIIAIVCTFIVNQSETRTELITLRFFHFYIVIFYTLYIFIFDQKYDIIYFILFILIKISIFLYKFECPLSYYEKKILNKKYMLGDNIIYHPFIELLFGQYNYMYVMLQNIITAYTFSAISYKIIDNTILWYILVTIVFIYFGYYNNVRLELM